MTAPPSQPGRPRSLDDRTTALVACIGIMVLSGGIYLFPAISGALSERLGLSNTELQVVGAAGNAGQWLGLVPGIMCDRFGVRKAVLIGAALNCVGLTCMGMAFQGWLPGHFVLLAMYNFVTAQGTCTTYVCSMKATQVNYDAVERGALVGLLACFFGLSSGLTTFTYKTVFEPFSGDLGLFLYGLAAFIAIVQVLCSRLLWAAPQPPALQGDAEQRRTRSVFVLTIGVLVVQFCAGLIASQVHSVSVRIWLWTMLVVSVLGFPTLRLVVWPAYFPLARDHEDAPAADAPTAAAHQSPPPNAGAVNTNPTSTLRAALSDDEDRASNNSLSSDKEMVELVVHPGAADHASINDSTTSAPAQQQGSTIEIPLYDDPTSPSQLVSSPSVHTAQQPSYTLRQVVTMGDFWLLFGALGGGLAFSITLLNNLAGVTASLDSSAEDGEVWDDDRRAAFEQHVGALVVLFSSANVAGRLSVGKLSERFQHRLPRLAWTAFGCAVGALGALLFVLFPSAGVLWIVVPLGGVAMGFLFGSAPLSTSDLFGLASFGTVWGVMVGAPCVSTILVATVAAGRMSDDAAQRHYYVMNGRRFCLGTDCFRGAVGIALGCSVCAGVAAVALTRRQRLQSR